MALSAYDLRCEARVLSEHIAVCERRARHCRGLAAITPNESVAAKAIEYAVLEERMAQSMASRLSRISDSLLALA